MTDHEQAELERVAGGLKQESVAFLRMLPGLAGEYGAEHVARLLRVTVGMVEAWVGAAGALEEAVRQAEETALRRIAETGVAELAKMVGLPDRTFRWQAANPRPGNRVWRTGHGRALVRLGWTAEELAAFILKQHRTDPGCVAEWVRALEDKLTEAGSAPSISRSTRGRLAKDGRCAGKLRELLKQADEAGIMVTRVGETWLFAGPRSDFRQDAGKAETRGRKVY